MKKYPLFFIIAAMLGVVIPRQFTLAQSEFNPHFILSDGELRDAQSWSRDDIQRFLDAKGSYLRQFKIEDINGTIKSAADIIAEAARSYDVNPKFLLVTLQKEQSLITDDEPTGRQLNWATGFAVCDGCSLEDPKVAKFKGFGKQIDGTASLLRWYYENKDTPFVKKKDTPVSIDGETVTPQSWATAFLYTYTPHLAGNKNFRRIWNTWFEQHLPNGTLLKSKETGEYWLIQNDQRRKFKNQSALISRLDPKLALTTLETDLVNYPVGPEISFPNYSLLRAASTTYLLDYDTLRPFASEAVVRTLGYNPQEIIEVNEADVLDYFRGIPITASTTAPTGIVYRLTDLPGTYYLLKDGFLYPLLHEGVVATNFKTAPIEKHLQKDLRHYPIAEVPIGFADGTLLTAETSGRYYVVDQGKRRLIADDDTFFALGYNRANVVRVPLPVALNIPEGEPLYVQTDLISAEHKFLGDVGSPVSDLFSTSLPSYLVAEYPSGRIVAGKNIDQRRSIASLTKLMTAFEAVQENWKPAVSLTVDSKKSPSSFPGTLPLKAGEKIQNRDLLAATLIASVNPAAQLLARSAGQSETALLTAIEKRLIIWGADHTSVHDLTGLSEKNKSTARDLLKIFTKVLGNRDLNKTLGAATYSFRTRLPNGKIVVRNIKHTNQLMLQTKKPYLILASKTGFTEEAGGVLVMLIKLKKTSQRYVIITLGNSAAKRLAEPERLADWVAAGNVKIASQ